MPKVSQKPDRANTMSKRTFTLSTITRTITRVLSRDKAMSQPASLPLRNMTCLVDESSSLLKNLEANVKKGEVVQRRPSMPSNGKESVVPCDVLVYDGSAHGAHEAHGGKRQNLGIPLLNDRSIQDFPAQEKSTPGRILVHTKTGSKKFQADTTRDNNYLNEKSEPRPPKKRSRRRDIFMWRRKSLQHESGQLVRDDNFKSNANGGRWRWKRTFKPSTHPPRNNGEGDVDESPLSNKIQTSSVSSVASRLGEDLEFEMVKNSVTKLDNNAIKTSSAMGNLTSNNHSTTMASILNRKPVPTNSAVTAETEQDNQSGTVANASTSSPTEANLMEEDDKTSYFTHPINGRTNPRNVKTPFSKARISDTQSVERRFTRLGPRVSQIMQYGFPSLEGKSMSTMVRRFRGAQEVNAVDDSQSPWGLPMNTDLQDENGRSPISRLKAVVGIDNSKKPIVEEKGPSDTEKAMTDEGTTGMEGEARNKAFEMTQDDFVDFITDSSSSKIRGFRWLK